MMGRSFLISIWLLCCIATSAHATKYYEETFESVAVGHQIQDETVNGTFWDTYQGPAGYPLGTIANSPLTPPQGSRYIEWHTNCLSGYDGNGRCTPGNDNTQGTTDAGIEIFPTGFSFVSGTTYYLGAFFRYQRVSSRDIWQDSGMPDSWNKTFELSGTGTRWGIGIGWPSANYTATNGKFTADLWCSGGAFAWCTVDHPIQNQGGYNASNPYLMDYERWYAVVLAVTMHATSGTVELFVNGTKIISRTQQTMDAGASFDHHWIHSTIGQAPYDTPEHYIQTDHLLLTDSLTDVTNAGLMSDPNTGGGGGSPTPTREPILFIGQTFLTVVSGLQVLMIAGYFWERRSQIVRAAMQIWRYTLSMPAPKDLYWIYRYKRAVTRWQKAAPIMLDHQPIVTLEQREGTWQLRK